MTRSQAIERQPVTVEVNARMPYPYKDKTAKLAFVTLTELSNEDLARLAMWVGYPAFLTIHEQKDFTPPPASRGGDCGTTGESCQGGGVVLQVVCAVCGKSYDSPPPLFLNVCEECGSTNYTIKTLSSPDDSHSPPGPSEAPAGDEQPDPVTVADEGAGGGRGRQSMAQKIRFKCRGVALSQKPDATEEEIESFYQAFAAWSLSQLDDPYWSENWWGTEIT